MAKIFGHLYLNVEMITTSLLNLGKLKVAEFLKFPQGFSDQAIQSSSFRVGFDLLIPSLSVIFEKPGSEPSEILRGKTLDSLLDLLDFTHGRPPSLHCAQFYSARALCSKWPLDFRLQS